MKNRAALCVLVVLAGGTSLPARAARPLAVSFHFTPASRCKPYSPRISVKGTPPSAVKYEVVMHDHQAPNYRHGGGTVPVNNGTIPAGSLKDFRGPCPPAGQTHTYEIDVRALDSRGKVVASGKAEQQF